MALTDPEKDSIAAPADVVLSAGAAAASGAAAGMTMLGPGAGAGATNGVG